MLLTCLCVVCLVGAITSLPIAAAAASTAANADEGPIRILPLGDSITQGGRVEREEYTYRLPLFGMLTEAGVSFDFIGSMDEGLQPKATWPKVDGQKFDMDHEGHYGWKTAKVEAHLPAWSRDWASAPDIALIHLGTNDQGEGDYKKTIVEPMRGIIKFLRSTNPHVVVLVGHLNFNGTKAREIRALVEALAQEMDTKESPVKTVPFYEGWVADPNKPNTDTYDWAHPNPRGQKKMARKWFEAMKRWLPLDKDEPAPSSS